MHINLPILIEISMEMRMAKEFEGSKVSYSCKVIIEKSRGEGFLMEQDTIENVA